MKEKTFTCSNCGKTKEIDETSLTTGYAVMDGKKYCYDCCAVFEREHMRKFGKICLYLTWSKEGEKKITNWPGSLNIKPYYWKTGRHNIAHKRYDVWFKFEGNVWHGVTYGDNTQICHCRKTTQKFV